jgi:biotin transport system substrate-specific component
MFQTHTPAAAALLACVVPFLPGDALKITAASLLAPVLRKYLSRQGI